MEDIECIESYKANIRPDDTNTGVINSYDPQPEQQKKRGENLKKSIPK